MVITIDKTRKLHGRLQALSDVQLWSAIFLGRWAVVLAVLLILRVAQLGPAGEPPTFPALIGSPHLLGYVLLAAPAGETLFECSLVHLFMGKQTRVRPWLFASISALLMALIHPIGLILSILPLFTGLTLAYCYLNFLARRSASLAFAATWAMHSAINLTGTAFTILALAAESAA